MLEDEKSRKLNNFFTQKEVTENVIIKEKALDNLLVNFMQKVYNPEIKKIDYFMFDCDLYNYGYVDDYGYYTIRYDTFGKYLVRCYGEDLYEIFISLATNILNKKRRNYFYANQKNIKKDYRERFKYIGFADELFSAEYDLRAWDTYFDGMIPEEIVDKYEKHANNSYKLIKRNSEVTYDSNQKQLVFVDVKKRSLKK